MVSFLSIYQEEVLQDQDVTDLCSKLKCQSNHYWNAKRHVRDEIAKRDIHNLSDVSKVIPTCLQQSSVASEVARFSWHILQEFRDWTSTARFVAIATSALSASFAAFLRISSALSCGSVCASSGFLCIVGLLLFLPIVLIGIIRCLARGVPVVLLACGPGGARRVSVTCCN